MRTDDTRQRQRGQAAPHGFPLPAPGTAIENERWRLRERDATGRPLRYACAYCGEEVVSLASMAAHCRVQPRCREGPVIRATYPSDGLAVVSVNGEQKHIALPDLRLRSVVPAVAAFVRAIARHQRRDFRCLTPLSASELFTRTLLLAANAARPPWERVGEARGRLRAAMQTLENVVKRPDAERTRGRPPDVTRARAAVMEAPLGPPSVPVSEDDQRRALEQLLAMDPATLREAIEMVTKEIHCHPQPLRPTDPQYFMATAPFWRDLTVIDRLHDEERPVWAAIARAQAEALRGKKGRPRDERRDRLAKDLEALAREQAGVPLDPESARIVAAVSDVDAPRARRGRTRRLQAERHRRRRSRSK